MYYQFPFALLLLLLASCATKQPQDTTSYYDLETFFLQETQSLLGKSIEKTVNINGKSDTKKVSFSEEEFTLFLKANINDASFQGKYQVDSTVVKNNLKKLRYTAKEKKLKTRTVEIEFEEELVKSVSFFVATSNVIYSSEQQLSYRPKEYYEIKVKQDQAFSTGMTFELKATF